MSKAVAYHVSGDDRKITKSVGLANAWTEAGHDVRALIEELPPAVPYTGPERRYCGTCGHVEPDHWDHCAEAPDDYVRPADAGWKPQPTRAISDEMMARAMEAFWDAPGGNEAGVRAAIEAVLDKSRPLAPTPASAGSRVGGGDDQ